MECATTAELADATLPPLLCTATTEVDLAGLAATGGPAYETLLARWRSALNVPASPAAAGLSRVATLLDLIAEAQARVILDGRRAVAAAQARVPPAAPADAGALARQRGALAASCAALRVARAPADEAPEQTLARLRVAAESMRLPAPNPLPSPSPERSADTDRPDAAAHATATGAAAATTAGSAATAAGLAPPTLEAEEQSTLSRMTEAFGAEYATRRAMLLTRLEVLISTFSQSPRLDAARREEMHAAVRKLVAEIPPLRPFSAADACGADVSLLQLQRPASLAHTAAAVKKVRIGSVPDRGGRASELSAPTETFFQQARAREGKGGGSGGWKGGSGKAVSGGRGGGG